MNKRKMILLIIAVILLIGTLFGFYYLYVRLPIINGYAAKNSDISIVIPVKDTTLVTPMSEAFQAVIWHCIVSHPSLAVNATKW